MLSNTIELIRRKARHSIAIQFAIESVVFVGLVFASLVLTEFAYILLSGGFNGR